MAFEVIEGLNKSWEELTEDEREQCNLDEWKDLQPGDGSPDSAIKFIQLEPEALFTTVHTLEAIRDAITEQATSQGYRDEWPHIEAGFLLSLLQLRARSERGEI